MFTQPGNWPKEVWKYGHPANRQPSILLLTAAAGGMIGDGEGVGEGLKGMSGGREGRVTWRNRGLGTTNVKIENKRRRKI